MDRRRAGSPVFTRQRSAESTSTGSSSPAMSPAHPRAAGGLSGIKRSQNVAAKAAAARLAQVMATQTAVDHEDEDEDEEDGLLPPGSGVGGFRFGHPRQIPNVNGGSGGGGGGSGGAAAASSGVSLRANRSPSPALGRNSVEPIPSIRATSAGRPSSISTQTTPSVPPSRTTLRSSSPIPAIQPQVDASRNKGFLSGIKHGNSRETGNREDSALQDELDMLQEENDNVRAKLRLMEERCEEADARARELEKQVAALGDGVSLEAKLLSRKEAALRQREAALKAAAQTKDGKDEEVSALRQEVDSARDRAANAIEQCLEAEAEVKSLRSMTQRMILTQEEMEEVVLKRCWLARYWGLALQHGVYPDIAISKYEHWSSLAPLPFEVVVSAGQKAKDESCYGGDDDPERRNNLVRDLNDIIGEGNIESMLAVEKGLRELASLKVEDAVVLAMVQLHRPNFVRISNTDLKSPGDPKFMEALELSQEESEDVYFKQAWLTYFWRRAKAHGVEEDVAEERLQFWIGRGGQSLTLHDAVDVERGLVELRKLGIEQQLWEASRRDLDQNSSLANSKPAIDLETAS